MYSIGKVHTNIPTTPQDQQWKEGRKGGRERKGGIREGENDGRGREEGVGCRNGRGM